MLAGAAFRGVRCSHTDLVDLMDFVAQVRVTIDSELFPLSSAADVLRDVADGKVPGRAVLVA